MTKANKPTSNGVSRRRLLRQAVATGAGVSALSIAGRRFDFVPAALAQSQPPIGTWPAGSSGPTVTIGATVPRTGAYAVQGEDELKGMQLAVEHINEGHPIIKQIAPKVTKGVLGKQVKLVVADFGRQAEPGGAGAADLHQRRQDHRHDRLDLVGGRGRAQQVRRAREDPLPGGDFWLQRHHRQGLRALLFRQCFYGETAANAIGPVLVKAYGKGKKAAFMTPDYTYGHTVTKSVNDYLSKNGGWTMVTNQISPLGTTDFSQYLTNIANSGAEFIVNVNWGRDAVLSIQQAKQFGLTPKMKMVVPYQIPFLAKEVGPALTEGVYAATDFWWTLEDKYPLAKMFVDAFDKKYGYKPEWGANNAYMQFAIWARMVSEAGSFYPPDVIKTYEKGETFPSTVGDVHFRAADHQLVRPVVIVRGKAPSAMKNKEDFWEVTEIVPGEPLMQKPDAFGCHLGDYT